MRRPAIDIRKEILRLLLKEGELSFRELESKVDTNNLTIKRQIDDLESLGFVSVKDHKSHPMNNKPYQSCKITENGIKYIKQT